MSLHDELVAMIALLRLLEEIDEHQDSVAKRARHLPDLVPAAREDLRAELLRDHQGIEAKLSNAAERLQALKNAL